MPADAKATQESSARRPTVLDAKTRATTVGIVDWKTIAPVMLPIASVSLPWRTQMIELNFSGSSVAIGAMTRARSSGIDAELVGQVLDRVDEEDRAEDDQAERGEDLEVDDPQPRHGRVGRDARERSSRWNRSGARSSASTSGSASKWPLTYQA